MHYYEVLVADASYRGSSPLTYGSGAPLARLSVVSVPLKDKFAIGFIAKKVAKPSFEVKPVRAVLSAKQLPAHYLELAKWLKDYYGVSLGESLRQFTPSRSVIKRTDSLEAIPSEQFPLDVDYPLTADQKRAIDAIQTSSRTTILLHGATGSGKTRVYLELAAKTLGNNRSVIILTPEIALTSQLVRASRQKLKAPVHLVHSHLSVADRKKIWFKVLESDEPAVIIGPRSALFLPISQLGLIIIDEAHEPAYKQEQPPRYHALRVASQLGLLTSSKVVLGSATPSLTDYYVADRRDSLVEMRNLALTGSKEKVKYELIDIKNRGNFSKNTYLSNQLIGSIGKTLADKKQAMIYFNRRGTARLILCSQCGWQALCPNCDIPAVYHGDEHLARCHICGYSQTIPPRCPNCGSSDVLYKSPGTKTIYEELRRLFPSARINRFDSDNKPGERLNDVYDKLLKGEIDILVGTQLVAKGLDLPRLSLVGVVSAESSLSLPDYTADERSFQLLYQVVGRVGRGHMEGEVIVQSYHPNNHILLAALERDWDSFYQSAIKERQTYRFPPFSYLLKLSCRRTSSSGAKNAADKLKAELTALRLPVEIIGPSPSFYAKKGKHFSWQLIARSKDRKYLLELVSKVPAGWTVDLDPQNLL